MTIESDSSNLPTPESILENDLQPDDFDGSATEKNLSSEVLATQQALAAIASLQSPQHTTALKQARSDFKLPTSNQFTVKPRALLIIIVAIAITFIGVILNNRIIGIIGTAITLLLSLAI
ncbi:MAG: pentapeptide repeat-containing protein, partial [Nostoc sp.]